jgi:hypothetical protein
MSSLAIGSIVFGFVFAGAVLGMQLERILPQDHLNPDAKDVIKVSMAMVATVAALVLGLLTATAKTSFDDKEAELRKIAEHVILLDRTMAKYGPETAEGRTLLKENLAVRINLIWPEERAGKVAPEGVGRGEGVERVREAIFALSPNNETQRWLQSTALQITRDIEAARWSMLEQIGSNIQWPLLAIVAFWLATVFASFGLFAPHNPTVGVVLFVAALCVAGSIYLIIEMDQPYSGLVKLSSEPLRMALAELGR